MGRRIWRWDEDDDLERLHTKITPGDHQSGLWQVIRLGERGLTDASLPLSDRRRCHRGIYAASLSERLISVQYALDEIHRLFSDTTHSRERDPAVPRADSADSWQHRRRMAVGLPLQLESGSLESL